VLSHDNGEGRPRCSLRLWGARNIVNIEADGIAAVPDEIVKAVAYGVPIPQGWSLFGWNDKGIITTLTLFCTKGARQLPRYTWMPLAGLPEAQWPPYASESLFGRWFWDSHQDGKVIPLARLIAGTLNTVYWVDTSVSLGSGCCAVARDFGDPEGPMLRRGCYVYCEALRAGKPVPSLTALLAQASKLDLGLQFQRSM
jgi:hypothetical protein